jgi:hypothetical protein
MLTHQVITLLGRTKKHLGDEYFRIDAEKRAINKWLAGELPWYTSPALAAKEPNIVKKRLRKNIITRRLNSIHLEMQAIDVAVAALLERS